MIKHEEARSFLCLLPAKLKDFYSDYITEQKKKDELLALYREKDILENSKYLNRFKLLEVITKISKLEGELK